MTFLWGNALWLLLAPGALAGVYIALLRRRKPALRYAALGVVREAMTSHHMRRHIPAVVLLAGLIVFVVAIARPTAVVTLPYEHRTIILAIDVSLSMAAQDVAPSRLEAAKAAARTFVLEQPRDVRVGILAFAGEADLVQPPTTNRQDAIASIDRLQLQPNTAIGTAVIAGLLTIFPDADIGGNYEIFGMGHSPVIPRRFSRNEAPRPPSPFAAVPAGSYSSAAIILLTDGKGTLGPMPELAARLAAERGIRVYTVGFGNDDTAAVELDGRVMDAGFDESTLRHIAATTHGQYFHATDGHELNNIYRNLNGRIVLEKSAMELTALLTAIAAVLSVLSAGLSMMRTA
jgi:Ca-activated chloride channel family protein